ncbi:Transcription termination/antitermination protein NusA [Candidatus Jidaibacter acanthamoeba]|uniref:Transcription termination/antitermination protein NusA n=1 Tax=Candidatus Jidaibacter acanthamoebae TaxID=86105 RepID=A0A0C1MYF0_9RICK|nr:transcription termination factor NusA [Candidatus Jidaibacter acanthamoeba]KIE04936.1 Transcription termination/antitermination protein NusA [Candidatus Jidaibacter acanthamoeba]
MSERSFGSTEILQIADAVAREKSIHRDLILEALEEAVRIAARRKYGHEHSVRAEIDRKTGEIRLYREMLVVDNVEDELGEEVDEYIRSLNKIALSDAKNKSEDAEVGDIISEPLPPIDLGRVAAQSAKQVITNKVREIEKNKQYDEFKNRVGEIISGVIEKVEYGNILIKIGSAEALIKKENLLKNDKVKQGDRIRALVLEVNKDSKGPQIVLTRTHNDFLSKLFTQEVPEIYDRIIEIKAVARDPGLRSKIAVYSSDSSIDAVGSCVGVRGSRVQAVISELGGEKIDIIPWSSDYATLVVNALAPAGVTKVIIDEDKKRIEAVVPDEQLSIAIGKRGQNVRLASQIVGWNLDVITEDLESKRRTEEFNAITAKFMAALDLEEILAQLLASEGFSSIQDIADAEIKDLANIEGLDEGIAEELISRAGQYALVHEDASQLITPQAEELSKVDPEILKLEGITNDFAIKLYKSNIKELNDLADLSHDELVELCPKSGLSNKEIDNIIMAARKVAYFEPEAAQK